MRALGEARGRSKREGPMSRFIVALCMALCACSGHEYREPPTDINGQDVALREALRELEEHQSQAADEPPPEHAPPHRRPAAAESTETKALAQPAAPDALQPGTLYMPADRQRELDRLVADVDVERGWTLGRPEIVDHGQNVSLRIERGPSAVIVIMSPAETASSDQERSESFAIRVGTVGVDAGLSSRIATPVIDAIKQNDPGDLWTRAL
jgi:hypothetical protein